MVSGGHVAVFQRVVVLKGRQSCAKLHNDLGCGMVGELGRVFGQRPLKSRGQAGAREHIPCAVGV